MRTGVLGDVEIVHPVSAEAKFEPKMRTFVLGRPEAGESVSPGVTKKEADATSLTAIVPVTVTPWVPGTAVLLTWNEAVTTPLEILQVVVPGCTADVGPGALKLQFASSLLK
jgi:hypothetical protein